MAAKLRFRGLDLLRGVAAFGILEQHLEHVLGWNLFNRAYLAVDLFFMLSGFVIAYSYEGKLLGGLRFIDYARARLIRLYPLAIMGTLLGAAVAVYELDLVHNPLDRVPWAGATLFGILLLPGPYLHRYGLRLNSLFPFDVPLWSLFWEVVVSLAYGLVVRRAGSKLLVALATGCAAVLFFWAWFGNLDKAWTISLFWLGPFKILFSFSVGILLFRAHQSGGRLSFHVPPGVVAILFLVIAAIPKPEQFDGLIDFALVLVAFPLMVFLAADANEPAEETGFADWAGRLSYPVYALQYPFRTLLRGWVQSRLQPPPAWVDICVLVGCEVAIIGFAAAVLVFIDEPLRGWLVRRSRARPVGERPS